MHLTVRCMRRLEADPSCTDRGNLCAYGAPVSLRCARRVGAARRAGGDASYVRLTIERLTRRLSRVGSVPRACRQSRWVRGSRIAELSSPYHEGLASVLSQSYLLRVLASVSPACSPRQRRDADRPPRQAVSQRTRCVDYARTAMRPTLSYLRAGRAASVSSRSFQARKRELRRGVGTGRSPARIRLSHSLPSVAIQALVN